jgi:4-diphosphocytidyl-2-C-methyl-D-erythritol kinase
VTHAHAFAKINIGLLVGSLRADGKHEIVTLLQRIDLRDDVWLEPAADLAVEGFADDTIVRAALESIARAAGVEPRWRVRIDKRIPVASGLGGGSSDAAAALGLANALLPSPLDRESLHRLAADLGADVPFFLTVGPQVATGDGSDLEPVDLPTDYHVALVLPSSPTKASTAAVYREFDERGGGEALDGRDASFRRTIAGISRARDLGALPLNDLVSSPLVERLRAMGAFRADVSGAGPTVYGLFERRPDAEAAAEDLAEAGLTTLARPVAR